MKPLTALLMALLLAGVLGCDGDGDGTTDTTAEETGTVEETKAPVIIDAGSDTVGPKQYGVVSSFSVFETGMLEARVEWSNGPSKLDLILAYDGVAGVSQGDLESPATLVTQVTQDLLGNSDPWNLVVYNIDDTLQVDVDFTVRFTPD